MKISDPSSRLLSGAGAAAERGGGGRPAGPAGHSVASDQIQLSQLSAQLSQSGSAEHIAKLSHLTAAVTKGQYGVDAGVLSADIIQYSLALGSTVNG